VPWTTPGGDLGAIVGQHPNTGGVNEWRPFTLDVATVQDWVSNPDRNFGFMIRLEGGENDACGIYASEAGNKALTPKLTVMYDAATRAAKAPVAAQPRFQLHYDKGVLAVSGLRDGAAISVFAPDGKCVARAKAVSGRCAVDIRGVAAGMVTVVSDDGNRVTTPVR